MVLRIPLVVWCSEGYARLHIRLDRLLGTVSADGSACEALCSGVPAIGRGGRVAQKGWDWRHGGSRLVQYVEPGIHVDEVTAANFSFENPGKSWKILDSWRCALCHIRLPGGKRRCHPGCLRRGSTEYGVKEYLTWTCWSTSIVQGEDSKSMLLIMEPGFPGFPRIQVISPILYFYDVRSTE
jgi:hypothetical protein